MSLIALELSSLFRSFTCLYILMSFQPFVIGRFWTFYHSGVTYTHQQLQNWQNIPSHITFPVDFLSEKMLTSCTENKRKYGIFLRMLVHNSYLTVWNKYSIKYKKRSITFTQYSTHVNFPPNILHVSNCALKCAVVSSL